VWRGPVSHPAVLGWLATSVHTARRALSRAPEYRKET